MFHHLRAHVSDHFICFFWGGGGGWLDQREKHYRTQGLWVVIGLLSFLLLEKMFPDEDGASESSAVNHTNKVILPCAIILHSLKNIIPQCC